ncbi:MAG: hypothetical protein ACK5OG_07665, partial [Sphingomonadaceae bacterium]
GEAKQTSLSKLPYLIIPANAWMTKVNVHIKVARRSGVSRILSLSKGSCLDDALTERLKGKWPHTNGIYPYAKPPRPLRLCVQKMDSRRGAEDAEK